MPQRIQRRRTKGWRMPEGAVYVGRPTEFGNPWLVGSLVGVPSGGRQVDPPRRHTAETATRRYRRWLTSTNAQLERGVDRFVLLERLHELRGKDLACWCPLDQPCHADVLLELANSPEGAS